MWSCTPREQYLKSAQDCGTRDRLLNEALKMFFGDTKFDYFPGAAGYEAGWLYPKLVKNQILPYQDEIPDVECLKGLINTPAAKIGCRADRPVDWKDIKRGDVIKVVVPGSDGIPSYTHYLFAYSDARLENGEHVFEIFHSMRVGKGPEICQVRLKKDANGGIQVEMFEKSKNGDWTRFTDIPRIYVHKILGENDKLTEIAETKTQDISGLVFAAASSVTCCDKHIKIDLNQPLTRTDPLVLDLDRNGIYTCGLDEGLHFDHDANGFSELTGWVGQGDGVLMLDLNGNNQLDNGRELFGDYTILSNGGQAANGFEALASFDINGDGKIDANDPIWSQLRVWQGYADNLGYVGDPNHQGKISSLDELGINSISLTSSISNTMDSEGNTEIRAGHFQWRDGTVGAMSEYQLQRDLTDIVPLNQVDTTAEIEALPNLRGSGNVYDLHQAMAMDGSLETLVQQFMDTDDLNVLQDLMTQILSKWVSVGNSSAPSRVDNYDQGKLVVLESIFAETLINESIARTVNGQVIITNQIISHFNNSYQEIYEFFYSDLMAQTHLKPLYDKITYNWDETKQESVLDPSALVAAIQDSLATDPENGKELLSEFARSRRGLGFFGKPCYLAFRESFIQLDPSLGWVFDTGGLPVLNHPAIGDPGWDCIHLFGTDNAEAIKGDPAETYPALHGVNGDDVIYGTDRNEILRNQDGNSLLVGGGGNDTIWAGADDDILDGGAGRDTLYGETGNDTYIFRRGSGQDRIIDVDSTTGNTDTIWLGSSLTRDEITLTRVGWGESSNPIVRLVNLNSIVTICMHKAQGDNKKLENEHKKRFQNHRTFFMCSRLIQLSAEFCNSPERRREL